MIFLKLLKRKSLLSLHHHEEEDCLHHQTAVDLEDPVLGEKVEQEVQDVQDGHQHQLRLSVAFQDVDVLSDVHVYHIVLHVEVGHYESRLQKGVLVREREQCQQMVVVPVYVLATVVCHLLPPHSAPVGFVEKGQIAEIENEQEVEETDFPLH